MARFTSEIEPFSLDNDFDYDNSPLTSLEVTSVGCVESQKGETWNSLDNKMARKAREKEKGKGKISHLAVARSGSATLSARMKNMFTSTHADTPEEGAKYLNIVGERKVIMKSPDCLIHHDHAMTVKDLETRGIFNIVATIRHPVTRIESGHRRRLEQQNVKKPHNRLYYEHYNSDINLFIEGIKGNDANALAAVNSNSNGVRGQWWMTHVASYLNGTDQKTRITWLRTEHLDKDWNMWVRETPSGNTAASEIAEGTKRLNSSSAGSHNSNAGKLNDASIEWVKSEFADDLQLWSQANEHCQAHGQLFVTDGSGRSITEKAPRKVFCIGFHKTGTTSLGKALQHMGLRVCNHKTIGGKGKRHLLDLCKQNKWREIKKTYIDKFDAFEDTPWPVIYKHVYGMFPGAKYILTLRDSEKWLQSVVNHFGSRETDIRKWIYGEDHGAPLGSESTYLQRFESHVKEVVDFSSKTAGMDLLKLDICKGEGWNCLLSFLNKGRLTPFAAPSVPFPRANVRLGNVVCVCVSNDHNHPIVALMRATCPFPLKHDLFSDKQKWPGNRTKLSVVLDYARTLGPDTIVCHVDAYDVVFTPCSNRLLEDFLRTERRENGRGIVYVSGVRTRPFPKDGVVKEWLDPKTGTYVGYPIMTQEGNEGQAYFCNSGAYIGRASAIVNLLELLLDLSGGTFELQDDGTSASRSDQELFHAALSTESGKSIIRVDAQSASFCSLGPRPNSMVGTDGDVKTLAREKCGGPVCDFQYGRSADLAEFTLSADSGIVRFHGPTKVQPATHSFLPAVIHGNGSAGSPGKYAFYEHFVPAIEQMVLLGHYGNEAKKTWVRLYFQRTKTYRAETKACFSSVDNALNTLLDKQAVLFDRRAAIKYLKRDGGKEGFCALKKLLRNKDKLTLPHLRSEMVRQLSFRKNRWYGKYLEDPDALDEVAYHCKLLTQHFERVGTAVEEVGNESSRADFMVLGAQKCGTSSIVRYLLSIEGIRFVSRDGGASATEDDCPNDIAKHDPLESRIFDQSWPQSVINYHLKLSSCNFEKCADQLTGHYTAQYFANKDVPKRIRDTYEVSRHMKFLVLLREPVSRAVSCYWFKRETGQETRAFAVAMREEMERYNGMSSNGEEVQHAGNTNYIAAGVYHQQLIRWWKYFERDQFLIRSQEAVSNDSGGYLSDAIKFLQDPSANKTLCVSEQTRALLKRRFNTTACVEKNYGPEDEDVMQAMRAFYEAHNQTLYALIGKRLWP
jgi:hypothetical protein